MATNFPKIRSICESESEAPTAADAPKDSTDGTKGLNNMKWEGREDYKHQETAERGTT